MTFFPDGARQSSKEFVAVGIHLAGARSKRSGVVRGRFKASVAVSNSSTGVFQRLVPAFSKWFPGLEFVRSASKQDLAGLGPLMIDAHMAELGPEPDLDADSRLFEAIADLGPANFYVFDAPLSLPPCINCSLSCPGTRACSVEEVSAMNEMWHLTRMKGRKEKAPQPYIDRYFDYFLRHVLDEGSRIAGLQFDASMGSNRAPLTARARFLAKRLRRLAPHAVIMETQSVVAAMGWGLFFRTQDDRQRLVAKKQTEAVRPVSALERKQVVAGLLGSGRINFGSSLDPLLRNEFGSAPEVFLAGMGALIPRSLVAGEIFFQDDLVERLSVDSGFPLLPAAVGHYIDKSPSTKVYHEPI